MAWIKIYVKSNNTATETCKMAAAMYTSSRGYYQWSFSSTQLFKGALSLRSLLSFKHKRFLLFINFCFEENSDLATISQRYFVLP